MSGLSRQGRALVMCVSFGFLFGTRMNGQEVAPAAQNLDQSAPQQGQGQPDHAQMNMNTGWNFMQDAIVFAEFNHQGSPRGGNEFVVPNWWMGMASRGTPHGQFTLTSMLSLDPATVGKDGYGEIFQVGESLEWPAADRSPASPRSLHAACRELATAVGIIDRADVGRRAGWRTGARSRGVHASRVCRGQPHGAAESPYLRFDPHLVWRDHRGRRSRSMDGRRVALQWARAR